MHYASAQGVDERMINVHLKKKKKKNPYCQRNNVQIYWLMLKDLDERHVSTLSPTSPPS